MTEDAKSVKLSTESVEEVKKDEVKDKSEKTLHKPLVEDILSMKSSGEHDKIEIKPEIKKKNEECLDKSLDEDELSVKQYCEIDLKDKKDDTEKKSEETLDKPPTGDSHFVKPSAKPEDKENKPEIKEKLEESLGRLITRVTKSINPCTEYSEEEKKAEIKEECEETLDKPFSGDILSVEHDKIEMKSAMKNESEESMNESLNEDVHFDEKEDEIKEKCEESLDTSFIANNGAHNVKPFDKHEDNGKSYEIKVKGETYDHKTSVEDVHFVKAASNPEGKEEAAEIKRESEESLERSLDEDDAHFLKIPDKLDDKEEKPELKETLDKPLIADTYSFKPSDKLEEKKLEINNENKELLINLLNQDVQHVKPPNECDKKEVEAKIKEKNEETLYKSITEEVSYSKLSDKPNKKEKKPQIKEKSEDSLEKSANENRQFIKQCSEPVKKQEKKPQIRRRNEKDENSVKQSCEFREKEKNDEIEEKVEETLDKPLSGVINFDKSPGKTEQKEKKVKIKEKNEKSLGNLKTEDSYSVKTSTEPFEKAKDTEIKKKSEESLDKNLFEEANYIKLSGEPDKIEKTKESLDKPLTEERQFVKLFSELDEKEKPEVKEKSEETLDKPLINDAHCVRPSDEHDRKIQNKSKVKGKSYDKNEKPKDELRTNKKPSGLAVVDKVAQQETSGDVKPSGDDRKTEKKGRVNDRSYDGNENSKDESITKEKPSGLSVSDKASQQETSGPMKPSANDRNMQKKENVNDKLDDRSEKPKGEFTTKEKPSGLAVTDKTSQKEASADVKPSAEDRKKKTKEKVNDKLGDRSEKPKVEFTTKEKPSGLAVTDKVSQKETSVNVNFSAEDINTQKKERIMDKLDDKIEKGSSYSKVKSQSTKISLDKKSSALLQPELEEILENYIAKGRCRTRQQAEIAVKLLEMQFEEEKALEAAKICDSIEQAITYLQQDCDLCSNTYAAAEMVSMIHCSHQACRNCLKTYFTVKIKDQNIIELKCPFCDEPDLFDKDIAQDYYNHMDILLRNILDPEVHELFQRKLRDQVLMQNPNFHWCSQCSSGFIAFSQNQRKLMCPDCKVIFCSECRKPWLQQHEGISCKQFHTWAETHQVDVQTAALGRQLEDSEIDCPNCSYKYSVAKGGCLHIRCIQCQFDFCSGCGAQYKIGRKCHVTQQCLKMGFHGHHLRNCLYYLRKKNAVILQKLLTDCGIMYETEPPTGEKMNEQCSIVEPKKTPQGLKDEICGRNVLDGYAGLCRTHYTEYLAELVRKYDVDPLPVFTTEEMELLLKQSGIPLPLRLWRDKEEKYRKKLIENVENELPLRKFR